jgi:hypothetical protein
VRRSSSRATRSASPTFSYSYTNEAGIVVTTASPPVEPGYYTVTASFAGNGNYEPASATASITISITTLQLQLLTDLGKVFKTGQMIPIKLQLTDAGGNNLSSAGIAVAALQLQRVNADGSRTTVALQSNGNSNQGNLFRYDTALGGYIINLSTKGLAAGNYVFTVGWTLNGVFVTQELTFRLR